jgi:hypothetical protein
MTEVGKLVNRERDSVSVVTVLGKHRGRSFAMNGMWRNAEQVGDWLMCRFGQWWNDANGETRRSLTDNAILFTITNLTCSGLG